MPDPRDDKFLEALRVSEIGAKIASDIEAARTADRKQVADALAKLHLEVERDFPKLAAAQEKAFAEYRELEKKLATARQKLAAANSAKISASAIYTSRRHAYERELIDSSSPLLIEFESRMHDELAKARKAVRPKVALEKNAITGRVTERVFSNAARVNDRTSAIMAAIEAARDMRLIADQTGVAAALFEIEAALPPIEEL